MSEVYNGNGSGASSGSPIPLHQIAGAVTVLEPFGDGWWRGPCALCDDDGENLTIYPNGGGEEEVFECGRCHESGFAGDFVKLLYSDAPLAGRALTDLGNAERLIARHGGDLRYCHAWRKWLVWDGKRWRVDDSGAVRERAKDTVRSIYDEAKNAGTDSESKALASHAMRSESRQRVEAMISLAESSVPVRPDALDADPWLLNAENGTVELSTGELREHRRENLITKLAPVAYDPDAEAPIFGEFLERILPAEALRRFVQRAIGYAAIGIVSEEMLTIFYGVGANGKSTFVNAIMEALGGYAMQAAPELLLAKRGAHPTELADLFGARFVASVEVDEGRRLAESLVKQLTGRDKIRARRMREDFWEFPPTHTAFLATNHRPEVRGTDHAIWRRIKLVPFEETIPEEEQDKRLAEKLRGELPGLLAWIVRGCLEWQREGLGEPEEVTKATAGYKADMDVLAAFVEERCTVGEGKWCKFAHLYEAYVEWCEEAHEHPEKKRRFADRLTEAGYEKGHGTDNVAIRKGIGLRHGGEPDPSRINEDPPEPDPTPPETPPEEENVNPINDEPEIINSENPCKSEDSGEAINEISGKPTSPVENSLMGGEPEKPLIHVNSLIPGAPPPGAEGLVAGVFDGEKGASINLPLYYRGETTRTILTNSVLYAMGRNWKRMDPADLEAWERVVERVTRQRVEGEGA